MDINYLISMIIIIVFCLLGYTTLENLTNDVTYIRSEVDGNEYLVRNLKDKQKAADLLAKIRIKLEKLCKIMLEKFPKDESIIRLNDRFNADNIVEAGKNNVYTSYSINKGEKIVFCIRQKDEQETIVNENLMLFVAIHELGHVMSKSVGHNDEFWSNFKRLLKVAVENSLYKNEDYAKSPRDYCGIKVSDSPLN
jgi:hypothetical protein